MQQKTQDFRFVLRELAMAPVQAHQRQPHATVQPTTVTLLIRQLHSKHPEEAHRAIETLRAKGWLSSGALKGVDLQDIQLRGADLYMADLGKADLRGANLTGADLSMANLEGANFDTVNLTGADLSMANLEGAINLSNAQLAQTSRLWGATMPDGTLYDGRFALVGDAEYALISLERI